MSDAVAFAQWRAARQLLERGAATARWQSAALGLLDRVEAVCTCAPPPLLERITKAFRHVCRGGERLRANYLLGRGADMNWVGHAGMTPCDAAHERENDVVIRLLRSCGATHR